MTGRVLEREEMVERQLLSRGIRDERVLAAMRSVPREAFIAGELAEFAYEDAPLPIEAAQTISQPYIVAAMTAALELAPHDRVLEVGTGSGYAAAILSRIAAEVYTIERHEELAVAAERRLHEFGYTQVGFYGLDLYSLYTSIDAVLPAQFDEYLWFDETRAVTPLGHAEVHDMPEETYPFVL